MAMWQLGLMEISIGAYGQLIKDQLVYLKIKQMYRDLPSYEFLDALKVLLSDESEVKKDAE